MRQVLFIGMSPNPGGIETFMMNIFNRLEGHGFHFVFTNTSPKPIAYQKDIVNRGGEIKSIILNQSLLGHLTWYRAILSFFKEYHDYDAVYLNTVTINYIFWLKAAEKYHIKTLIIHSHNDGIVYPSKIKKIIAHFITPFNIKYLCHHSNIVKLAVSQNAGKWMFHSHNFHVINNGIDVDRFRFNFDKRIKVKRSLGLSSNNKVIITVARLELQKNYFRILKIFNLIHKMDKSVRLVIVGDGSEKLALERFTHRLGIASDVIFMGIVNNVNEVLSIADLMLMPSKYEGIPFSLIEAQASGVPALVSKESVPTEVNVTKQIKYISLNESNMYWTRKAYKILHNLISINNKIIMNKIIQNSKYNMNYSTHKIKKILL